MVCLGPGEGRIQGRREEDRSVRRRRIVWRGCGIQTQHQPADRPTGQISAPNYIDWRDFCLYFLPIRLFKSNIKIHLKIYERGEV